MLIISVSVQRLGSSHPGLKFIKLKTEILAQHILHTSVMINFSQDNKKWMFTFITGKQSCFETLHNHRSCVVYKACWKHVVEMGHYKFLLTADTIDSKYFQLAGSEKRLHSSKEVNETIHGINILRGYQVHILHESFHVFPSGWIWVHWCWHNL